MNERVLTSSSFYQEVITEKEAIPHLQDGEIYVVDHHNGELIQSLNKARTCLFERSENIELLNTYHILPSPNLSSLHQQSSLFRSIQKGANIIIPIFCPDECYKQYLVTKLQPQEAEMLLPGIVAKVESISKTSIEHALRNLAKFEPETCLHLVQKFYENFVEKEDSEESSSETKADQKQKRSKFDDIVNAVISFFDPYAPMGMVPTFGSMESTPFCPTFLQSRQIFSRFVENCQFLKKAEKKTKFSPEFRKKMETAKSEIDYVFNTIWGISKNLDGFRKMFLSQSDKSIKMNFDNLIDREKIAQASKIVISIEKAINNDGTKNDGYYRVYASCNGQKKLVHFKRKPACIVYMIYLLDRQKRGDQINSLKISKNKDLFETLYTKVYLPNIPKTSTEKKEEQETTQPEEIFNGLFAKIEDGRVRQTRLKDCYVCIRHSLEEAINEFDEAIVPFIIPNEKSHITVVPEKIQIESSLKELEISY